MGYLCEDPNDALQRRMHEDMDTCAFTHFGMLEKTGAIEARAERTDQLDPRATYAPPRAAVLAPAPAVSIGPEHVVLALAALAAIALYVHSRRKR
jgi:hypothetical protein